MKSKLTLFAASFCAAAFVGNAAVVVSTDTALSATGTFSDENGGVQTGNGNISTFPLDNFQFSFTDATFFNLFAKDLSNATVGLEVIDVGDVGAVDGAVTDGNLSGNFSVTGFDISYTYTFADWSVVDGQFSGTFSFTATPVPEPSEYAAIAGAALIGFAAWRRGRGKVA